MAAQIQLLSPVLYPGNLDKTAPNIHAIVLIHLTIFAYYLKFQKSIFLATMFTRPCHNAPLLAAGMDGIKCS